MQTTQTTFGTVRRDEHQTIVSADQGLLSDWANRGDCRWPCSELKWLESITVTFDAKGDLVDIEGDSEDLLNDELSAWTSECLIRAGYPNHPAIRA